MHICLNLRWSVQLLQQLCKCSPNLRRFRAFPVLSSIKPPPGRSSSRSYHLNCSMDSLISSSGSLRATSANPSCHVFGKHDSAKQSRCSKPREARVGKKRGMCSAITISCSPGKGCKGHHARSHFWSTTHLASHFSFSTTGTDFPIDAACCVTPSCCGPSCVLQRWALSSTSCSMRVPIRTPVTIFVRLEPYVYQLHMHIQQRLAIWVHVRFIWQILTSSSSTYSTLSVPSSSRRFAPSHQNRAAPPSHLHPHCRCHW